MVLPPRALFGWSGIEQGEQVRNPRMIVIAASERRPSFAERAIGSRGQSL